MAGIVSLSSSAVITHCVAYRSVISVYVRACHLRWFATHDGVDVGGMRIIEQIYAEVDKYPSLNKISVIGTCVYANAPACVRVSVEF